MAGSKPIDERRQIGLTTVAIFGAFWLILGIVAAIRGVWGAAVMAFSVVVIFAAGTALITRALKRSQTEPPDPESN